MIHIGIIGGADGPTEIIVTSGSAVDANVAIALLLAGTAVMLLASWLYHRRRKRQ